MIIREADLKADALEMMDGMRDFVSRATYPGLFAEGDALLDVCSRVVTLKGLEILLAEYDGRVVGGIGMMYAPYLWNPANLVAEQVFWWAMKGAPPKTRHRLINEAMKRLDEKGAMPMFHSLTTTPSVACVYRGLGLEPIQTVFMRLT